MEDHIAIFRRIMRFTEEHVHVSSKRRLFALYVDQRSLNTGNRPDQTSEQTAQNTRPDNGNTVPRGHSRIPDGIQCRFHICRQHSPF